MIPKPAQYLLRFDDLCPTIPRARWRCLFDMVETFGVRPIVAIVPDNCDPELECAPADPDFWPGMRAIERAGATVAVHGYRHLCFQRGKSLLGLHRSSEFAGIDYETQRKWIHAGCRILREQGLDPRLWIAPRHGFDRNTVRALRCCGVEHLCDGFARIPHRRDGIIWIPQQLWRPVWKEKGLWTICIHPDRASAADIEELEQFLEAHHCQFTSFDRVLEDFPAGSLGVRERIEEQIGMWRARLRHYRRRERTLD